MTRTQRAASGSRTRRSDSSSGKKRANVLTEKEMIEESGMNGGRRADALGDVDDEEDEEVNDPVEKEKMRDRKSFSEVY